MADTKKEKRTGPSKKAATRPVKKTAKNPTTKAASKPVKKSALKPTRKTATKSTRKPRHNDSFPIVGIGASAGGLEAIEGFIDHMPEKSNMAFVIVQHLAPTYKSIMASLLQKHTMMEVMEVEDGTKVEPNCVYLNPPNKDVAIINRTLHLLDPAESHRVRHPIDYFFRTLAQDQGERAVCIVLSGTGTDGTLGLRSVKGEGGMIMVQLESQAHYDGMPRSAIDTGVVDYILPVEDMPAELIKYVRHPYLKGVNKEITIEKQFKNNLQKIFLLIRAATGHDFSNYKLNTIRRRIERRMAVHQVENLSDYVQFLRQEPNEVDTLSKDMLITVTNFFRDKDAFDLLNNKVIKNILKAKEADSTVRIWVPGCATGEEAYSLAILLIEAMKKVKNHLNVQIFATDIDAEAVEYARNAVYPESIAADVSHVRLKRFFIKEGDSYNVKKQVCDMVVFAVQNLIKDPPFSKLDLVSCRNVLIYMDTVLQKKIIPLFHYTLLDSGYLFLGSSESIGQFSELFSPVDNKWKIFKHTKAVLSRAVGNLEMPYLLPAAETIRFETGKDKDSTDIRTMAEKVILEKYSSPCVLVNEKYEILYFHGNTDRYLSTPSGEAHFNLLRMAREEIANKLSIALHDAFKQRKAITVDGIRISTGSKERFIDLLINPIVGQGMMMVVFDEKAPMDKGVESEEQQEAGGKEDPTIAALKQELHTSRESLQITIEEFETSSEELKSTNEELQSTNEELQSTNEELETSKEELHSTNEELETVNSELQEKVRELSRAHDDMQNILASTDIGTIFLDTELFIKRFTPAISRIFNLIRTDIGRPVSDITHRMKYDRLTEDAEEVLSTLVSKEAIIKSNDGKCYNLRILPYRTIENVIDGVVITFVDITEVTDAKETAVKLRRLATVVRDSYDAVTVQDLKGRLIAWNRGAERMYGYGEEEALKMMARALVPAGKKKEALNLIKEIIDGKVVGPLEVKRTTKSGRAIDVLLTTTKLVEENGAVVAIATTERDITGHKQAEEKYKATIRKLEEKVEASSKEKKKR